MQVTFFRERQHESKLGPLLHSNPCQQTTYGTPLLIAL